MADEVPWSDPDDWDEVEATLSPGRRSESQPAHTFKIPKELSIAVGLRWEFAGADPIDLDASCVLYNGSGECTEVVFYNNLKNKSGSVEHSGDNRNGEDEGDDDEVVTVHFNQLPSDIQQMIFCVTSPSGVEFTEVSMAACRLVNVHNKRVLDEFGIGVFGRHTATILCTVIRRPAVGFSDEYWELVELNIPAMGKTFVDLLPVMQDLLTPEIKAKFKEQAKAGGHSDANALPKYDMQKGEVVDVPLNLSFLKFGVGWDGENDVDAIMLMLDSDGNYLDHISPKNGKTATLDNAASHSGDKQHGFQSQDDDEAITIDLSKVYSKVSRLFFALALHNGEEASLNTVPQCYARMCHKATPGGFPKEVIRSDIRKLVQVYRATAFAAFVVFRDPAKCNAWSLLRLNEGTNAGRDWVSILPFIRGINRFVLDMERYAEWRIKSSVVYKVTVVVKEVLELGPLEPHRFKCHCRVWTMDHEDTTRSINKTSYCTDRSHVVFEHNTFVLKATLNDTVRVMVLEHAVVGVVDIPLWKEKWDPATQPTYQHSAVYPLVGFDITGSVSLQISITRDLTEIVEQAQGRYCVVQ
eukprot:PhF_6_TR6086/c0_g1_i1/m.8884